ncbi:MAG: hypothetical protein WD512_03960 [Candidatus Paceibacterota bacterium]
MMKNKTIRPTKEFTQLYQRIEKGQNDIYERIAELSGFNVEYCKKNIKRALEGLNDDQVKEIDDSFLKLQIWKQKMWSDFYYTKFPDIKTYLIPPHKIQYDQERKLVVLVDGNQVKEQVKRAITTFKEQVNNILGDKIKDKNQ